jgi:hypothetical protein
MLWYDYVAVFFAGAFLANGVPHFVQGICGNKFQSPFATPHGVGESSAIVNALWGWFNFVLAIGLLWYFLPPLPSLGALATVALGALVLALAMASHFGKVRDGAPRP